MCCIILRLCLHVYVIGAYRVREKAVTVVQSPPVDPLVIFNGPTGDTMFLAVCEQPVPPAVSQRLPLLCYLL